MCNWCWLFHNPLNQFHFTENAYNAVQDLLSIYGLTMSPNDIVDAFTKRNEAAASIRDLANSCKCFIIYFFCINQSSSFWLYHLFGKLFDACWFSHGLQITLFSSKNNKSKKKGFFCSLDLYSAKKVTESRIQLFSLYSIQFSDDSVSISLRYIKPNGEKNTQNRYKIDKFFCWYFVIFFLHSSNCIIWFHICLVKKTLGQVCDVFFPSFWSKIRLTHTQTRKERDARKLTKNTKESLIIACAMLEKIYSVHRSSIVWFG